MPPESKAAARLGNMRVLPDMGKRRELRLLYGKNVEDQRYDQEQLS